ncbi:SMI1/KNR4 family protein [Kitasatospora sp. NPDC056783]|uniref:SMI1/KNR4 family protein n=1 Tax=Kitasatospora sp. NPDC056783 TaxID=3345943 RepID=UPI0036AF6E8D
MAGVMSRILDAYPGSLDGAVGLTPEEIALIEEDQGVTLPEDYREFLALAGGGGFRAFQGESYEFPEILGIKEYARDILEEAAPGESLDGCVVVLGHQGHIYAFIGPAEKGGKVYEVSETCEGVHECAPSFASYLLGYLRRSSLAALRDPAAGRAAKRRGSWWRRSFFS